jgi:hypothetical protein
MTRASIAATGRLCIRNPPIVIAKANSILPDTKQHRPAALEPFILVKVHVLGDARNGVSKHRHALGKWKK